MKESIFIIDTKDVKIFCKTIESISELNSFATFSFTCKENVFFLVIRSFNTESDVYSIFKGINGSNENNYNMIKMKINNLCDELKVIKNNEMLKITIGDMKIKFDRLDKRKKTNHVCELDIEKFDILSEYVGSVIEEYNYKEINTDVLSSDFQKICKCLNKQSSDVQIKYNDIQVSINTLGNSPHILKKKQKEKVQQEQKEQIEHIDQQQEEEPQQEQQGFFVKLDEKFINIITKYSKLYKNLNLMTSDKSTFCVQFENTYINILYNKKQMITQTYITEQQKEAIESWAQYKLINGCAGSHKTDTLIKCAVRDLHMNGRPILFLTLVSSVTFEIKERLEKVLKIKIDKIGTSNHYMGKYNKIPVCISNYDAWVHNTLQDIVDISDIGDKFSEKVDLLLTLSQTESIICTMKNGKKVGLLLIDEVQDLDSKKANIIINISKRCKNMDIYCAGDYLQTIFQKDDIIIDQNDVHAMNIIKRIKPSYFDLNVCMRCPKAHVEFNNLIMNNIQQKYGIPPMISCNTNTIDKPVLFTHATTSNNAGPVIIAKQIINMIDVLMTKDKTILPNDIVIIMTKSNVNGIYYQLEHFLPILYKSKGFNDCVCLLSTGADGYHKTIDWAISEGKTAMLSIHGDKGKGHRVVFLLGVTEGSLPRENQLYVPSEIIPESLLNVGLTRSTKYLFIGFCSSYPSRYLKKYQEKLSDYCYIGWYEPNVKLHEIPEPYRSIIKNQHSDRPCWDSKYKSQKGITGIKSCLRIKDDISKDVDQPNALVKRDWKSFTENVFGSKFNNGITLHETHCVLLGIMCEILIQRQINRKVLFKTLKDNMDPNKNSYTNNECILSFMYDMHTKKSNSIDECLKPYRQYLMTNPLIEKEIKNLMKNNKKSIHNIFRSASFIKDYEEFISEKENEKLSTGCIWNITLFFNHITQKIYRPAVNTFLGYFNENIKIIHDNIYKYLHGQLVNHELQFEKELNFIGSCSKAELEELQLENNHSVGLSGRCDILDNSTKTLIEIKASKLDYCSSQWKIQGLCYVLMLNVLGYQIKKLSIVNILSGTMWEWDVTGIDSLENVIETKISNIYKWHQIEEKIVINAIQKVKVY